MTNAALNFDTWACVKELKQAGFTTAQAEAQTKVLARVIDENLATKQDIKELDLKIECVKRDIIIKLTSILGSITVVCFTVLGVMIVLLVR